ncbi:MAG TPA: helix-turn-helix transcriptional regulator [Thermoanaerobacterales bacterium]|nr:helix-turn-helix transcriptional regulator [Thermoanaerobacterales bacterium]
MREWLKILRNRVDMSQESVAKNAGISQQFYSFIENGDSII